MSIAPTPAKPKFAYPALGPSSIKATIFLVCLLFSAGSLAQTDCGLLDLDGQSGYTSQDLGQARQAWGQNAVGDTDGDNRTTVLDLLRHRNCLTKLSPGLIGRYYGFADGTPEQDIEFPDLGSGLDREPVVVRATEKLERIEGYRGFLDSEMLNNFGAVYEGFLKVPETANYTFRIWGYKGMRVFLDGSEVLSFVGWPREDEATLALEAGLYPIRIEYYVGRWSGRVTFQWSSDGSAIGADSTSIDQRYLFHDSAQVPEHAYTDLEMLFEPANGSRVTTSLVAATLYAMGPDSSLGLMHNGQTITLEDGIAHQDLALNPGLNHFSYVLTDSQGREQTFDYYLYRDAENATQPGLAANLYATEWYDGTVPDYSNLTLLSQETHSGTQLDETQGFTPIGNLQMGRGTVAVLEGTIQIDTPGAYTFDVNGTAGLWINGLFVGGIDALFPRQWDPEETLSLEAGRHHYRIVSSRPWSGPELRVDWAFEDGAQTPIPDSAFFHSSAHFHEQPNVTVRATGGRVAANLMAEYLFDPSNLLLDTSGNNFHFWPEPRAVPRTPGGASFYTAGGFTQDQGASKMVAQIKASPALSLEVDFIFEDTIENWNGRRLIALTPANWNSMAEIYIQWDNLTFQMRDSSETYRLRIDDVIQTGVRTHIAATWDGQTMRVYRDGQEIGNLAAPVDVSRWETLAHLSVGQGFHRRREPSARDQQMRGTFLAAACYNRALSQTEIQTNMAANAAMRPTPDALPSVQVDAFPSSGTTIQQLAEAHHILNRLSFGPTPSELARILEMGTQAWIDQQLAPDNIDDSALETLLAASQLKPAMIADDLRAEVLTRTVLSNRQLLEVITQFWDNHFHTQGSKVENYGAEYRERNLFRQLAFGNFQNLLVASASGYPMTIYLDNILNLVGAPNENYARELFELHSLGANNGYTQDDIVEAARCFTGWTVRNGRFFFNPGLHDYGAKQVLGIHIPAGGGISDGMRIIEHLMTMPETGRFIGFKLAQLLVSDEPPTSVVDAAANAFNQTGGEILPTLQAILSHSDFRQNPNYRANKTKTPLEFAASLLRITEAYPVGSTLYQNLESMGMNLFEEADPTGFDEAGIFWIDTNSLLMRWNLVHQVVDNRGNGMTSTFDIQNFIAKRGPSSADDIMDLFENLIAPGRIPSTSRDLITSFMTNGDAANFEISEENLDLNVRRALSLYLRLPEFNRQ